MVASRRLGLVAVTVVALGLVAACNGDAGLSASTATNHTLAPATGTPSGSSREPTPAAKALNFDCQTLLPRTRALLGTRTVSVVHHNPPDAAAMPTSEAEWQHKDLGTYPGTSCEFNAEDTFTADESNYSQLSIDVYQPGTWYRDHILFGDTPMGFACQPAQLPRAARAQWCTNLGGGIYIYGVDFGSALVEVNAKPDPTYSTVPPAAAVKAAIETDLAALTF